MASALALLDEEFRPIISRTYRSYHEEDIQALLEQFRGAALGAGCAPVVEIQGTSFVWVQHGQLAFVCVCVGTNANAMVLVQFLHQWLAVLTSYLNKLALHRDDIIDNYVLVHELFDETMDFGVVQLTDFKLLKEFIKLRTSNFSILEHKRQQEGEEPKPPASVGFSLRPKRKPEAAAEPEPLESEINASIVRTTLNEINWRPVGIFYKKNEIFVDLCEHLYFVYDLSKGSIHTNVIEGALNLQCYLSGMPLCTFGFNHALDTGLFFHNLSFHQCVATRPTDSVLSFIPPDGAFELLRYTYKATALATKPLFFVRPFFRHLVSQGKCKLQIMLTLTTHFKHKVQGKRLLVVVPLHHYRIDYNQPLKYMTNELKGSSNSKTEISLETESLCWELELYSGNSEYKMMAELDLLVIPDEQTYFLKAHMVAAGAEEAEAEEEEEEEEEASTYVSNQRARDKNHLAEHVKQESHGRKAIDPFTVFIHFDLQLLSQGYSGLKIEYLTIEELTQKNIKYTSFPWIKYLILDSSPQGGEGFTNRSVQGDYRFRWGKEKVSWVYEPEVEAQTKVAATDSAAEWAVVAEP